MIATARPQLRPPTAVARVADATLATGGGGLAIISDQTAVVPVLDRHATATTPAGDRVGAGRRCNLRTAWYCVAITTEYACGQSSGPRALRQAGPMGDARRRHPAQVLRAMDGWATWEDLGRLCTQHAVRMAVARGSIVRTRRGLYALPGLPTDRQAAADLGGVLSHLSAAVHLGLDVLVAPDRIHVTVPRGGPHHGPDGVVLHRRDVAAMDRTRTATRPLRTVLDCAVCLPCGGPGRGRLGPEGGPPRRRRPRAGRRRVARPRSGARAPRGEPGGRRRCQPPGVGAAGGGPRCPDHRVRPAAAGAPRERPHRPRRPGRPGAPYRPRGRQLAHHGRGKRCGTTAGATTNSSVPAGWCCGSRGSTSCSTPGGSPWS